MDLAHLYHDCRGQRESPKNQPRPAWGGSLTLPVRKSSRSLVEQTGPAYSI